MLNGHQSVSLGLFSGFYLLSQERRAQRSGVSLEERLEHAERQQFLESRKG
jgi:hypothetical protein